MKKFCLLLALLSGLAYSQNGVDPFQPGYIRVVGVGKSVEEAKNDAFKHAVNMIVGSALLSEAEVNNNNLTRNDIVNYSSGYIDKYDIVQQSIRGDKVTLVVDVIVKDSKIANRVLNTGRDASVIDGDRLSTQYKTYITERQTGDTFLSKVLDDFPKRAFVIKQGKTEFKLYNNRDAVLVIPYEIRWSYPYLVALNEALKKLEDGGRNTTSRIIIESKDPKAWLLGETNVYRFNDSSRPNMVSNRMRGNIMFRAKILDGNGNVLFSDCYVPDTSFSASPDRGVYKIYGNDVEENEVEIRVAQDSKLGDIMGSASKIELSIGCEL
jgi:hypothetical protein